MDPDLENVNFHLSENCVRSVFPNFVPCYFPLYQPHRELLSLEQSNSLSQLGIYFWRWSSCFLKLLEEILICLEERLWTMTSRFFSFSLCLWFFFGGIFWKFRFYRSFIYDIHKEQRGGKEQGAQNFEQFANGCAWFSGKGVFFSWYENIF